MKNKKLGFTLIELLVVISIISLLSSIILSSVQTARKKAELEKVHSNLLEIQKAVETYRLSHGSLPDTNDYPYYLDELVTDGLIGEIPENISFQKFDKFYVTFEDNGEIASMGGQMYYCGNKRVDEYYILAFFDKGYFPQNLITKKPMWGTVGLPEFFESIEESVFYETLDADAVSDTICVGM